MRTPPAAGWAARRLRELAEAAAVGGPRRHEVPPRRLRARTGAPGQEEFARGGAQAAIELEAALGAPLSDHAAILDFGCGAARVLPHVARRAPVATATGCDVDATAIAWAREHHTGLAFVVSDYHPPLPFDAGAFDLVYSISVFSHLEEELQDGWLTELARVVRPGGTALLSVHGRSAFEQFRSGAVRTSWCAPRAFAERALTDDGFLFVPYIRSIFNRGELPGIDSGYGLAFHGEAYVSERWTKWFEVSRVVPRALTEWQDVVVCRRPPD